MKRAAVTSFCRRLLFWSLPLAVLYLWFAGSQGPVKLKARSQPQSIADASFEYAYYHAANHQIITSLVVRACEEPNLKLFVDGCSPEHPTFCVGSVIGKTSDATCITEEKKRVILKLHSGLREGVLTLESGSDRSSPIVISRRNEYEPAETEIIDARYNSEENAVDLELQYSACEPVMHRLNPTGHCESAYPRICEVNLERFSAWDSSCQRLQREVISIPIDDAYQETILSIDSISGDGWMVLIDRESLVEKRLPQDSFKSLPLGKKISRGI